MSNEEPKNQNVLQIELTPDVAQGIYANMALIAHSSSEIIIDFVRVMPGTPKANVQSRVILAPEHAKRLLYALNDNVMKYEQAFGEIRLPGDGPRTIAPFKINKGEA